MRATLYLLARLLGDFNAARRGTLPKRYANKLIGRHVVRRLWIK